MDVNNKQLAILVGFVVFGGATYYLLKKDKFAWGVFAGAIGAMLAPNVMGKGITVAKPKEK